MTRDNVLNFRVPGDLKLALRRAAKQDERSMSMMAARILREWLAENGFIGAQEAARPARRTGKTGRRA